MAIHFSGGAKVSFQGSQWKFSQIGEGVYDLAAQVSNESGRGTV